MKNQEIENLAIRIEKIIIDANNKVEEAYNIDNLVNRYAKMSDIRSEALIRINIIVGDMRGRLIQ